MTRSELLAWLAPRTTEEGDCLLWKGRVDSEGLIRGSVGGKCGRSVRRWVWEEYHAQDAGRRTVTYRCGTTACLNPLHLVALSKSEACQLASSRGSYRCPVVQAKREKTLRESSPLHRVKDQVRADREQGLTIYQLEQKYGVTSSAIARFLRGETHRETAANGASVFNWRPAA